jgi:hypothetical protein
MRRTPAEALTPIIATRDEIIAISVAVTMYRKWLARTPESAIEQSETITLLERFQQRLIQPGSYQQKVRS